jgi:hypothetical protein
VITDQNPDVQSTAAAAPALVRPVVMPDTFDGDDGQKFKDWLGNFKLCAGLNAWNTDTRRKFLFVRLRGTAQEIYNNLDETTQTDYGRLKTAPIDQLDPAAQESRFRTEFRATSTARRNLRRTGKRHSSLSAHGVSLPTTRHQGSVGKRPIRR